MIFNIGYALIGSNLELMKNIHIEVLDGTISHIGKGWSTSKGSINIKHGLAMPALTNAHLHILDYAFLEYGELAKDFNISQIVSEPKGLKHKLLSSLQDNDIIYASKKVFSKLFKSGTTSALIFSELPEANSIIKKIAEKKQIRAIILGRPKREGEILMHPMNVDGIGLDSPLRYNIEELKHINEVYRKQNKLIATHVAETENDYKMSDFILAINYLQPQLIVHGLYLSEKDIEFLAKERISLAICPRSNMWFSVGFPPIAKLLEMKVNVVLGTDNAGIIEPDVWREMEVIYLMTRLKRNNISSKDIIKMATVNVELIKGLKISSRIEEGKPANFIILNSHQLDLERSKDIYASIIKRTSSAHILQIISYPDKEAHNK